MSEQQQQQPQQQPATKRKVRSHYDHERTLQTCSICGRQYVRMTRDQPLNQGPECQQRAVNMSNRVNARREAEVDAEFDEYAATEAANKLDFPEIDHGD